jgi:hypothetical protein
VHSAAVIWQSIVGFISFLYQMVSDLFSSGETLVIFSYLNVKFTCIFSFCVSKGLGNKCSCNDVLRK